MAKLRLASSRKSITGSFRRISHAMVAIHPIIPIASIQQMKVLVAEKDRLLEVIARERETQLTKISAEKEVEAEKRRARAAERFGTAA